MEASYLSAISFACCWPPAQAAMYLKCLIEGFSRRSTLISLNLSTTLTDEHIHYLVLLITACPLLNIQLNSNNIGRSMPLIAEALRWNTFLGIVSLDNCNIADRGLVALGFRTRDCTLQHLTVPGNPFTSSAVKLFLRHQFFSTLTYLDIGRSLNDEEMDIYQALNRHRVQRRIPRLTMLDMEDYFTKITATDNEILNSMPESVRTRPSKE